MKLFVTFLRASQSLFRQPGLGRSGSSHGFLWVNCGGFEPVLALVLVLGYISRTFNDCILRDRKIIFPFFRLLLLGHYDNKLAGWGQLKLGLNCTFLLCVVIIIKPKPVGASLSWD